MHILLTTFGLMMIMALFAITQWKNAETMIFTDAVASCYFQKTREETLSTLKTRINNSYYKDKPKTASKEEIEEEDEEEDSYLPDDRDPPDNMVIEPKGKRSHLLNVSVLFYEKNNSTVGGKSKACFQLLTNLMDKLYSKQKFYKKAQESYPNLHEHLISSLMEGAKQELEENSKKKWHTAEALSTIPVNDKELRKVIYEEFTGTKSVRDKEQTSSGYYPLWEFITLRNTPGLVSLWLAPKPVLYAIFQNDDTVAEFCQLRKDLSNERKKGGKKAEKDMKILDDLHKQKLEEFFKSHSSEFVESQFFDFAVSGTQPPKH